MRIVAMALAMAMVAACSDGEPDQEAIDAAVEKALAERDRADAEKLSSSGSAEAAEESDKTSETAEVTTRSTENLREGVPDGMGTPYGMCIRTLSIVGEHCGCMVNRAMDAKIGNSALVRLFGGDGSRATQDEADRFTRIVRSCSGYNITVRNVGAAERAEANESSAPSAAPRQASLQGRRVSCYFWNSVYEYSGACDFVAGPGGDFSTTSLDGPYFDDVTKIGLNVTSSGVGTLEILYPDGALQETRVTRSEQDRACWEAPRLTFCAR